jgi:hypothetical protein
VATLPERSGSHDHDSAGERDSLRVSAASHMA